MSDVERWRKIIQGDTKSWVLFERGTCVILTEPQGDLSEQAKALMTEWGRVIIGSSYADFDVTRLESDPGWVVGCHHPDILTYVPGYDDAEEESADSKEDEPSDLVIGLIGRGARGQDAEELVVVHVEDKRTQA